MSVDPMAGDAVIAAIGGVEVDVVVVVLDEFDSLSAGTVTSAVELPLTELVVPAVVVSDPPVELEHAVSTSISDAPSPASSRRERIEPP
jgi:hypothetical protein